MEFVEFKQASVGGNKSENWGLKGGRVENKTRVKGISVRGFGLSPLVGWGQSSYNKGGKIRSSK